MKPFNENSYEVQVSSHCIKDISELNDIPKDVPIGTIVEYNNMSDFKVYVKTENGTWDEI